MTVRHHIERLKPYNKLTEKLFWSKFRPLSHLTYTASMKLRLMRTRMKREWLKLKTQRGRRNWRYRIEPWASR